MTAALQVGPRIASGVADVLGRMAEAARRSGRDPAAIRLVAVSKGQPADRVREAYAAGARDVGENRVEEGIPKKEALRDLGDLRWHMVGRVQSRKAAGVVSAFDWVHSLDRLKLAHRLDREAVRLGRVLPVLLECSLGGENSKAGWMWESGMDPSPVFRDWEEILSMAGLWVVGLMTIAPQSADPDRPRVVFAGLRSLLARAASSLPGMGHELSMGMTGDFESAVEEGATIIRVGRAIFGTGSQDQRRREADGQR
ncbi:MAG: YggS family pyridoxal phosphate-dependent enzyme, partial [Anaerolineales bacterium]